MDRLKFLDKVIKVDDVDTLRRYFNLLMKMSQSSPKYKRMLVRDLSYVKKQIGGNVGNSKITKYIYVFPKKNGTFPEEYRLKKKEKFEEINLTEVERIEKELDKVKSICEAYKLEKNLTPEMKNAFSQNLQKFIDDYLTGKQRMEIKRRKGDMQKMCQYTMSIMKQIKKEAEKNISE